MARLLLLLLPLLALGAVPQAGGADAREALSGAGRYRVRYRLSQDPPPQGELFSLEAWVLAHDGVEPLADVGLLVDGDMPEHGHGLPRAPLVKELGPGHFRAEGLRLHMPGRWRLYLDVVRGPRIERAIVERELE
jgi:hypothetical protein